MSTHQWLPLLCVLILRMDKASSEDVAFQCTSPGFFPDSLDCHNFYRCDESLNVIRGTCTPYGHFDPVDTCVWGGCTNPVTTTTTPAPTTTGFICTTSGYFPDPSDCRAFYQCSNALVATHGFCMAGKGFYNTETLGCEIGTC
ncbi:hypothetical protein B7P43_G11926 [Cryptotermes secundus]|uniref:Chitin-binding type-2 domain-containing protein n=1 Tax=Cryptotermes secundus TaxID=105785 RepID=A0A2J7QEL9_9NEOP|nr:uncharacterized protein LOC111868057 [Cryptotermes secundus]PNF27017.1 hypothetical protein B7P43_G11926 [Cryptotermes secundus]